MTSNIPTISVKEINIDDSQSKESGKGDESELTEEQIVEMRKQLEQKKREIEEERKRIAQRREQRQMMSTSSSIFSKLSVGGNEQKDESLGYKPLSSSSFDNLEELGSAISQKERKRDLPVTIKVERANLNPKSDCLITFTILLISEEDDKEVTFDFNILEDTVPYVAHDLVIELQLHIKYEETIQNLLTHEVDRLMREREANKRSQLLFRAQTLESLKRFGEAEFCYTTLKELLEDDESEIDMRQAIHIGLGFINYKDKQYKEARNHYEQFLLLESRKKLLPGMMMMSHNNNNNNSKEKNNNTKPGADAAGQISNTLKAFIGLAKVHSRENNFKQAESILKGVLMDQGENELSAGAELARSAIVKVYEKQGKLYEAELVYKRLSDDYNHTYTTLESQALKLIETGNLTEAQMLFKEAERLKECMLPILECLALLYVKHNKYVEAMDSFTVCLELKEKLRGPEHFSIAETLCHTAQVYVYQSRWEEAEAQYARAIKICEKGLHSNDNLFQCSGNRPKDELQRIMNRNQEIKKSLLVSLSGLIDLKTELQRNDEVVALKRKLADLSQSMKGFSPKPI